MTMPPVRRRAQPPVAIQNVSAAVDRKMVLRDVSLEAMRGDVVCITGPRGAGKTTLLRCINALVPASSGSIRIEGIEVNDPKLDKRALRKKVGMVAREANLFPHLTLIQNVILAPIHVLKRGRAEAEAAGHELLSELWLAGFADCYPAQLSDGQQLCASVARALAMNPAVMLFDVAARTLQSEIETNLRTVVGDRARQGTTWIVAILEPDPLRDLADHVHVLEHGVIVEDGSAK